MKMVLFGPPGAGKGTQAEILTKKLGVPAISTGGMLRDAVRRGTPVGLEAKKYMDAGELVPDEVIIGIVFERVSKQDCEKGYILDGVPRTIAQAETLDKQGLRIDAVLSIEISDDEILVRLGGRRACLECGATYHIKFNPPVNADSCDACNAALITRSDDKPEAISTRLKAYYMETEPLKAYYRAQGKLSMVDGTLEIEEINAAICQALDKYD